MTSVIVACELRYGAAKRKSRRLAKQVEAVLGALPLASTLAAGAQPGPEGYQIV